MGKIVELQTRVLQITKVQVANTLLASVSPAVTGPDIASVSIAGDNSFIDVELNPTTASSITTTREFWFTVDDLANLVLSSLDASITDGTNIETIQVNATNTTKIDVTMKTQTIAEY
jgi:hypothetical protein